MKIFSKFKKKEDNSLVKMWHTPGIELLSVNDSKSGSIYVGESIAKVITGCGCACDCIETISAPQITTYHFKLHNIMDITKLKKPIAVLSAMLHTTVTQTQSNFGHFALIIPRKERKLLRLRECILTETFCYHPPLLRTCLGGDCNNYSVVLSIQDMPHILIAGSTGSGKSVLLNSIIISLLYSCTPACARFIMIDPKKVELSKYEGLPHLEKPIIKDHSSAVILEIATEEICSQSDVLTCGQLVITV